MATITWTEEAQRWLADIFEYIAADNPRAAAQTVDGIYEQAQVLLTFQRSAIAIGHHPVTCEFFSTGTTESLT